jgi:hypothetical protein
MYVHVHSVFMLHVSAAQGPLQTSHFFRSLLHCALRQIVLLRHVIVVIIRFDDVEYFPPIFCIAAICFPLGVPVSWLCAFSVDLCSLYRQSQKRKGRKTARNMC